MRILVTGAGGFLGLAVSRLLLARGDRVVGLQRRWSAALAAAGGEQLLADLADAPAVERAAAGADAVIHIGAKAGHWGPWRDYHAANVVGTANVLAACHRHRIGRLVYTSTPSVVHGGGDLEGVDESLPYPQRFHAHYPHTKALAERAVLAANGPALATVALRPHLIWGPGDNQLLPRILARARAGRLRHVGRADRKRVDTIYIDNAAAAHVQALDRLAPGAPCAGRAYFLAQGEPLPAADMINALLACAELPPVKRRIPYAIAYVAGALMEAWWTLARRPDEPLMTRFLANQLATAHWYDLSAARRDLGYAPAVKLAAGLARLHAHLQGAAAADPAFL